MLKRAAAFEERALGKLSGTRRPFSPMDFFSATQCHVPLYGRPNSEAAPSNRLLERQISLRSAAGDWESLCQIGCDLQKKLRTLPPQSSTRSSCDVIGSNKEDLVVKWNTGIQCLSRVVVICSFILVTGCISPKSAMELISISKLWYVSLFYN